MHTSHVLPTASERRIEELQKKEKKSRDATDDLSASSGDLSSVGSVCVCVCVCVFVCMYDVYIYMYVCMHIYVCMYVCMYYNSSGGMCKEQAHCARARVCVCVCVCVCVV
jgi:hypothetical protein